MTNLPEKIIQKAEEVSGNLFPPKSRNRYEEEYNAFLQWCTKEKVEPTHISDDVVLVYLSERSGELKPSTQWSRFSMLKSCLKIKQNVDIGNFPKTVAYLKRLSVGYEPKKSKTFTSEELQRFMTNAPDEEWLLSKVIMVIGVFGACRADDLININVDDVKDYGDFFMIFLNEGKTHKKRSFTITNDECPFNPCHLIRKYMALRPKNCNLKRFLICYRQGRCVAQNVGIHKIRSVPKTAAQFLNLSTPELYTGHAIRRTSASLLVEGGGDLLALKSHGGWKSSAVAEGYIENSIARKVQLSRKLFSRPESGSSTAASTSKMTTSTMTSASTSTMNHTSTMNPTMIVRSNDHENEIDERHIFNIDDVLAPSSDEDEGPSNKMRKMGNEGAIVNKITSTKLEGFQKKLNEAINVTNNQNCTININLNF
jgi:integrase